MTRSSTPNSPSIAPAPRVMVYSRFSAEMQSRMSAEDQERENRRFAQRQGWVIVGAERDEAVRAGATAGRLGYQRVLEAARDRRFDVLLVEEMSRFSRDFLGGMAALAELRDLGVKLADTKNGVVDLDSPVGQLRLAFDFANSQAEAKRLGERSKRGLRGKILSKFSAGGHPPYGLRREPIFSEHERDVDGRPKRVGVRFVIDEQEAPIIRRIFSEYDNGKSKHAIARDLNVDAVPTKRGNGTRLGKANSNTWSTAQVKSTLENEIYVGVRVWNRSSRTGDKLPTGKKRQHDTPEAAWDRVENFAPAIIDRDLFDRVRHRLRADGEKWKAEHTARKGTKYPLSGVLTCGACGASFVIGEVKKGVRYYRCSFRASRGDVVCSNKVTVAQPAIEARVFDALDVIAKDPKALADLVEKHNRRVDGANDHQQQIIDGLVTRRAAVTAERDRLVEAIAAGGAGLKVLVDGIAQREEQIKTLSARIEETQRLLQPRLVPRQLVEDDFAAGEASLFTGDVARDKELLGKLLETIVISSNGAIVVRFRDDTLFARVAAYEFPAGSSVPGGGRADRRRDHAWDADVFAVRHGDTAKAIIREVPGYRPRLRPASAAISGPPGGGPGGTENSISVPRGIRTLVATVKG